MSDEELYTSLESLEVPQARQNSSPICWTADGLDGNTKDFGSVADSSDAISSAASETEEWQGRPDSPDLPAEYWQVQRLIKYIKVTQKQFNSNHS